MPAHNAEDYPQFIIRAERQISGNQLRYCRDPLYLMHSVQEQVRRAMTVDFSGWPTTCRDELYSVCRIVSCEAIVMTVEEFNTAMQESYDKGIQEYSR